MKRALLLAGCALAAVGGLIAWRHHGGDEPAKVEPGRGNPAIPRPNDRAQGGDPISQLPVLADDDPVGTLRLEGQVVGEGDRPVAGATVVLVANPPRSITTQADGSFVFEHLVGRSYTLLARASAGVAGPVTARLTEKTEPIVLHLRAGATVAVTVVGSDGKPVDAATVELRGDDLQTDTTRAGIATFKPVVPGPYDIVAYAPGSAKTYKRVRVSGQLAVKLALANGAAVSGRVVDADGNPVEGARVLNVAASDFRSPADPRLDAITTDAKGGFRFAALPAGSVRFLATHPDHASGTSAMVTLDGVTEKRDVVVTLAPGVVVRGKVVDIAGGPIEGARVRIGPSGRGGRGGGGGFGGGRQPARQAYSDASGGFSIRGLPREPLVASATHEKGGSSGVDVDASKGDVDKVVITLDLTASIAGEVVDLDGNPVEGAQVLASPRMDGGGGGFNGGMRGGGRNVEITDAGGRFKLTGLAEGNYRLRASRSGDARGFGGGRGRRGGDGVDAKTGDDQVKIVLPGEGGVKGKVAFTDGHAPTAITVTLGPIQDSFMSGDFEITGVPPGNYNLQIRGPSFDSKGIDVTVESNKTADVGAISVTQGRQLAGIVVSGSQPVAGATVYAGRQVIGGGSTNDAPMGNLAGTFGGSTKTDTTGPDGSFSLAGFGDGNLTIVADLSPMGRSKAVLVPEGSLTATQLVIELLPYGSISGLLMQGNQPAAGLPVTAQSTTTPGALNVVAAGPDGAFSFDRLAPDTYKVSATIGSPRRGLQFYSQQVDVPPGANVTVNLTVNQGQVELDLTAVATGSQVGMGVAYISSVPIAATTAQALSLSLAAAGPGTSQMSIIRAGAPAVFSDVMPGTYSACVVALPLQVQGMGAISYAERHGGTLPSVCQPVTVASSPAVQSVSVTVQIPPYIADPPGGGGGSGGAAPH